MILDNEAIFWDKVATPGAASDFIDLETVRPGPGEPVLCFVTASGAAPVDSPLSLIVQQSPDGVGGIGELLAVSGIYFENTPLVEFRIPSNADRYIRVQFNVAPTAGDFTAGVVMQGNQTAV